MTYEQLFQAVLDFYGDTSRSPTETVEALETLREEVGGLIESLGGAQ